MSQPIMMLLAGNSFRFLLILVYFSIGILAVLRRAQLGAATVPAALGASSLALANIVSLVTYFWQITAAMSGREALRHLASVLTLTNYVGQSLAVIGAVMLGFAVFTGRPAARRDNLYNH